MTSEANDAEWPVRGDTVVMITGHGSERRYKTLTVVRVSKRHVFLDDRTRWDKPGFVGPHHSRLVRQDSVEADAAYRSETLHGLRQAAIELCTRYIDSVLAADEPGESDETLDQPEFLQQLDMALTSYRALALIPYYEPEVGEWIGNANSDVMAVLAERIERLTREMEASAEGRP